MENGHLTAVQMDQPLATVARMDQHHHIAAKIIHLSKLVNLTYELLRYNKIIFE